MTLSVLDVAAVRQAQRSHEPYDWFLGSGILKQEAIDEIKRDFPDISKPGYLTVDEVQLKGRFKTLINELESDEFSQELSNKFGIDLTKFPRLTTIMKRSQPKYGAIHTDGPSKVMTLLVYMNDEWQADASGRLRVLYNEKDFESYAAEVPPTMGTVFASCAPTIPGTATSPSRESATWSRSLGSRTPTSSPARRSATRWRSSSRASSAAERRSRSFVRTERAPASLIFGFIGRISTFRRIIYVNECDAKLDYIEKLAGRLGV
jgi:SM-20-related protein